MKCHNCEKEVDVEFSEEWLITACKKCFSELEKGYQELMEEVIHANRNDDNVELQVRNSGLLRTTSKYFDGVGS